MDCVLYTRVNIYRCLSFMFDLVFLLLDKYLIPGTLIQNKLYGIVQSAQSAQYVCCAVNMKLNFSLQFLTKANMTL